MKPIIKSFKPGMHLFHENDRTRELYIIQSGNIKVYRTTGNREIELAVLGKGAVLGEMALIDGKPRSASAKAIDDCVVAVIDSESFFEKIAGVPGWFMTIIKMASQKIRLTNLRLKTVQCEHEEANIIITLYYLFKKFNFDGAVSLSSLHHNLTALLGVTNQQISLVIEFLIKNCFLENTADHCTILDISRFKEYCDFLHLLIRKSFVKVKTFPSEMTRFIITTAADYPGILECSEPATSLSGNEFWALVLKTDLENTYSNALVLFKENNLLTCIKSESKGTEQNQNPLAAHQFKINNLNWKRVCLYAKYNQYMNIA
jgi:CRP-like cAMP-binding protein